MVSVFFSYSHKDEEYRDELEIHLSALKRQGLIEVWHDRRIQAGSEIDGEIESRLESADIILLLVSPYFIASDYCYGIEMKRALERHHANQARVIPVIVHPCDWHETPFGKLRATPTDGKPISTFPSLHEAYLDVTSDIRSIASEFLNDAEPPIPPAETAVQPHQDSQLTPSEPGSSNLRVKRAFSDAERMRFASESFEYTARFFENSLRELQSRASGVETEFRFVDSNTFLAFIYAGGARKGKCKIWLSTGGYSSEQIMYSSSGSPEDTSWNESLSVEDDGYTLGLVPMGMSMNVRDSDRILTQQGAAELYWAILIEPLQ